MGEVAEGVLNLTRAADDVAGRCLIGAHKAKAGVSPPAAELQIGHRKTAGDLLFDGEDFRRIGDSSRATRVEAVEQNALHAGSIDRPVARQRSSGGDRLQKVTRSHTGSEVDRRTGSCAAT